MNVRVIKTLKMRVRSIPPITSTGTNRRKSPARLDGLAHMSIGRYMSEMAKNRKADDEEGENWNIAKHTKNYFTPKPEKKIVKPVRFSTEQKTECVIKQHENYNSKGDFAITLLFSEIEFQNEIHASNTIKSAQRSYFIPLYSENNENGFFLLLTTTGDIFECEIVRDIKYCSCSDESCFVHAGKKTTSKPEVKELCPNRSFRDEVYIPSLLQDYDPLSMQVELTGGLVTITYKKLN